jgi:hypothetical protein
MPAAMHKHGLSQERAASCFWVLDNKGLITRVSILLEVGHTCALCHVQPKLQGVICHTLCLMSCCKGRGDNEMK